MKSFLILLTATAMLAQAPPNPQSRVAGRFVASSYGTWSIPLYTAPSGTGLAGIETSFTVELPGRDRSGDLDQSEQARQFGNCTAALSIACLAEPELPGGDEVWSLGHR